MTYFSNTTQAFYADSLRSTYQAAKTWPDDALQLSTEQEILIRNIQMSGKLAQLVGGQVSDIGFQPDYSTAVFTPQNCTPAQGLVALLALKQITEEHVLEAIAQIPDPVHQYTARIGYQRATVWERGSPTMQSMAQLLQLSEENLDALFAHAVTVQM